MIRTIAQITVLASCIALVGCQQEVSLTTENDKQIYAVGYTIGKDIKSQDIKGDSKVIVAGIADAFKGEAKLSEEEIKKALEAYRVTRQQEAQQNAKIRAEQNKAIGQKFLAENANREGVKTTKSGLQYKVIKKGAGKVTPKATDKVTVHYTGRLLNGTVFDSSKQRNQPASFQLNQVIPGWTEGLQLMTKGAVHELYIPAQLAYGANGAGPVIGPNETLVFEVTLLDIGK